MPSVFIIKKFIEVSSCDKVAIILREEIDRGYGGLNVFSQIKSYPVVGMFGISFSCNVQTFYFRTALS